MIAIVGLGCRFPDADDPAQLWDTVLNQRRAFRRMPVERMDLAEYYDADPQAEDKTYSTRAALLEGWEFDRAAFRVPGPVYRATDPVHWLALETAGRALDDAGFPLGEGLARDRVAVIIGNTLTGEMTRAASLRARWPYVRRIMDTALVEEGLAEEQRQSLLDRAGRAFRAPFEPVGDETLAGSLSNTIAGRICNHFDFHGGGYTVDGACASSLLAVANACSMLIDGACDFVLAGGVDLSLDPFELVGFAKAGALAQENMRVYDERAAGFWPGEGCGMVALMRAEDARSAGLAVHAEIAGWGVSSDGKGGMTRPEPDGQVLALRRACERAGISPGDVDLYEGHGTGTDVGDHAELTALLALREGVSRTAALGSVKANIGHTKAAAGVAGLIKATMSVSTGVLPPATGCGRPHALLRDSSLRILDEPEPWPRSERLAGVSAMGFGGINAHVILRSSAPVLPVVPSTGRTPQADLFAFAADDAESLGQRLDQVASLALRLSEGELHDLASAGTGPGAVRVAFAADTVEQLAQRARLAATMFAERPSGRLVAKGGVYVGDRVRGRVTLLLPGQGAPVHTLDTAEAQPAIYTASLAALERLETLGLRARAAIGHSLGELTGLVWAGCLDADEGLRLVRERGRLMSELGTPDTGMVGVAAELDQAKRLCEGTGLVIAAYNGPRAHVLAGAAHEVELAAQRARDAGIPARVLQVTRAFHSSAVSECAGAFKSVLAEVSFTAPRRRLVSTVVGRELTDLDALTDLLCDQISSPVLFDAAVREVLADTDLFCEAGPGSALSGLASEFGAAPAVSLGSGGEANVVAALFAAGAVDEVAPFFAGRSARPIDIWRERTFLTNPCSAVAAQVVETATEEVPAEGDVRSVVVRLVAAATELEPASITPGLRLLSDLHLTSLRVARLVAEAARLCSRRPPMAPLTMADSSIAEVVTVLEALPPSDSEDDDAALAGIAPWVGCFVEGTKRAVPGTAVPPEEVVVIPDATDTDGLLKVARAAVASGRLTVATHTPGLAGFLRSLHHEHPTLDVTLVRTPPGADAREMAAPWAGRGWREIILGADGSAEEVIAHSTALEPGPLPVGPQDVVLVSGGGKGIGYLCAAELARQSGAALAILGRSRPEDDEVLAANLDRLQDIRFAYEPADVTDREAVAAAALRLTERLGAITAIIHASGINEPMRFSDLTDEDVRRHCAPKVAGLRNLLAAVGDPRLVVTFGSVIGQYGMAGECAYAQANGALRAEAEKLSAGRVLHLDWSLWSGAGMGERLGVVDTLLRAGVTAISPDEGTDLFLRAISSPGLPAALAVHGRVGPEAPWTAPSEPRGRFMETVRVHYPGVELIAEARLDLLTDPYLLDHRIDGLAVVPAVVCLEALAQAASALAGRPLRVAEAVSLDQPVIVPEDGVRTIRICALRRGDAVDVVLRSDETGFSADHVRARFPLVAPALDDDRPAGPEYAAELDPADLYGPVYFHEGRFRRVTSMKATATRCRAEIGPADTVWFDAILGGPAVNDATIHALQACVPHRRLLPVGCDRVTVGQHAGELVLTAVERHAEGGQYTWDAVAVDRSGRLAIRWEGLRLKDVGTLPRSEPWPLPLLAVYLERAALALGLDPRLRVGISRSQRRLPPAEPRTGLSRSHLGELTLTVNGGYCDWERVDDMDPPPQMAALVEHLAARCDEPRRYAAARVWTAVECLSKAGRPPTDPLVLNAVYDGGWVALRSGDDLIATVLVEVAGVDGRVAVSLMTRGSA